jgi:hypothetical protein
MRSSFAKMTAESVSPEVSDLRGFARCGARSCESLPRLRLPKITEPTWGAECSGVNTDAQPRTTSPCSLTA